MGKRSDELVDYFKRFQRRYSLDRVRSALEALRPLKVVVVGDIIIDEYFYCKALGKSSKSATLTARYVSAERQAGGVLAVANHVAGFVDDVQLVTYRGLPESDDAFIRQHLKPAVTPHLIVDPVRPTVVKRRYVDPFQVSKMFEIMWLNDGATEAESEPHLLRVLNDLVPACDLVIVTDFGHGAVTRAVIDALTQTDAFLAVNTQTNSANFGYNVITKWGRCDYFSIDEEEIRLANHDRYGDLRALVDGTSRRLGCQMATVTRGRHGSLTWSKDSDLVGTPVFSSEVVDSVGAGDAYLSITSLCAKAGYDPELVGFVGNCVGAVAVTIVGNRESVEPDALDQFIQKLY